LKGQETGRVACLREEEVMMGQLRVGAEDQQPLSQYKRKIEKSVKRKKGKASKLEERESSVKGGKFIVQ
jgi:hypothetical protein